MRSGAFTFPATERIVHGRPAPEALSTEVARLNAQPKRRGRRLEILEASVYSASCGCTSWAATAVRERP